MKERLADSVKKSLELLERRNLKGDVFGIRERNISYFIKKGELSNSLEYVDYGLGIRVLKDGRVGFGYCTPGDEEEGVDKAKKLSYISQNLDLELPGHGNTPDPNIYDGDIVESTMDDEGAEFTQQVINGAKEVKDDIIPTRGALTINISKKILGNTKDLFSYEAGTAISAEVLATIPGDRTSINAGESRISRKLDVDFKGVGKTATKKVDSLRERSELPDGEVPVVMSSDAFCMLLGFGMAPAVNGENIRKGKSVYDGRMGEQIASKDLVIKDDPTMNWGIGSGGFDDEGVPSRELSIIEDGTLKNFLYDLEESVKSGMRSTGNGIRGDFKSPPEISQRNLVIRGKGTCREDLLPRKGILVDDVMGAHTLNPASGDFSVVATPAWLVEDGEVKGKVEGAMVSGNLPEALNSIELADDYKQSYESLGSTEIKMDLPSARFNDVTISGQC